MAKSPLMVDALQHDEVTRISAPTAELQPVMETADKAPLQIARERGEAQ
jgi:hypothetical protein